MNLSQLIAVILIDTWILMTNFWNDSGKWKDDQLWKD